MALASAPWSVTEQPVLPVNVNGRFAAEFGDFFYIIDTCTFSINITTFIITGLRFIVEYGISFNALL
jgi:hypothetical protein